MGDVGKILDQHVTGLIGQLSPWTSSPAKAPANRIGEIGERDLQIACVEVMVLQI
jgi:hypothetical protein